MAVVVVVPPLPPLGWVLVVPPLPLSLPWWWWWCFCCCRCPRCRWRRCCGGGVVPVLPRCRHRATEAVVVVVPPRCRRRRCCDGGGSDGGGGVWSCSPADLAPLLPFLVFSTTSLLSLLTPIPPCNNPNRLPGCPSFAVGVGAGREMPVLVFGRVSTPTFFDRDSDFNCSTFSRAPKTMKIIMYIENAYKNL